MILEADKQTGVVRKHYIGMVTMLDILAHIAGDGDGDGDGIDDLEQKMSVPVSALIEQCLESLSLWTLNPNTSITSGRSLESRGMEEEYLRDSIVINIEREYAKDIDTDEVIDEVIAEFYSQNNRRVQLK